MFYTDRCPVKGCRGRELASPLGVEKSWGAAPGICADCGSDAYIRMDGDKPSPEMLCAHCYAERIRHEKALPRVEQPSHRASGISPQ